MVGGRFANSSRKPETRSLSPVFDQFLSPVSPGGCMEAVSDKHHAHELIERLPESQIDTAVRFLEFMLLDPVSRSIATAPVDDEPLTAEEEQALARADAWLNERGGRGVPPEEILAEFVWTMKDFPLNGNGA